MSSGYLARAHTGLLWVAGVYAVFLASLTFEPIQRSLVFLHQVRLPLKADYARPEIYGYAPGKVSNFYLTTPNEAEQQSVTLGAWHVLPAAAYDEYVASNGIPIEGALPQEVFDRALKAFPTILYFHGNAATRAASNRVRVGRLMSSDQFNFVIIDYRGFGDSSGVPSEAGLLIDARTAFDYLVKKGVNPSDIAVMGQSLGTGVATGLVSALAAEGTSIRALVLIAPFSSIPSLIETYRLGGVFPILAPFASMHFLVKQFLRVLRTKFDTLASIKAVTCPILIIHAVNDPTIPSLHSHSIFKQLLSPLLPPSPLESSRDIKKLLAMTAEEKKDAFATRQERERLSKELVVEEQVGGWGTVRRFDRVVFGEAVLGGHNDIGSTEHTVRLIREIMKQ